MELAPMTAPTSPTPQASLSAARPQPAAMPPAIPTAQPALPQTASAQTAQMNRPQTAAPLNSLPQDQLNLSPQARQISSPQVTPTLQRPPAASVPPGLPQARPQDMAAPLQQTMPQAPAVPGQPGTQAMRQPMGRAEEIGQKVGQTTTKVLQENPELLAQVEQLDLESMMHDPNSVLNDVKEQVQQSRWFKRVPKRFDSLISRTIAPKNYEGSARKLMNWLRQPVQESASPSPGSDPLSQESGMGGPQGRQQSIDDLLNQVESEPEAPSKKSRTSHLKSLGRMYNRIPLTPNIPFIGGKDHDHGGSGGEPVSLNDLPPGMLDELGGPGL